MMDIEEQIARLIWMDGSSSDNGFKLTAMRPRLFKRAKAILDLKHNGLTIREILQKWEEGKLVELDDSQREILQKHSEENDHYAGKDGTIWRPAN